MTLQISDTSTVQALQEAFSALFPYLRLEVYEVHGLQQPIAVNSRRAAVTTLAELYRQPLHAELVIHPTMSVVEFEKLFRQSFGLHVEVFRRSGRVWLKTMMTDEWSLEFQNEQGRVLSQP